MTNRGEKKVPVRVDLTPEEVAKLQARFKTQDAGKALGFLILMGAGLWLLGEALKESEERPAKKRKRTPT